MVESFTVHSPRLTIQTSSVPYWLFFNSVKAAQMLEQYLDGTEHFNEMYMMILSHGKSLGGVASIRHWESILSRAGRSGQFVGMNKDKYPVDFGVFTRYNKALQKAIPDRYPVRQITLEDFQDNYSGFLHDNNVRFSSIKQ